MDTNELYSNYSKLVFKPRYYYKETSGNFYKWTTVEFE